MTTCEKDRGWGLLFRFAVYRSHFLSRVPLSTILYPLSPFFSHSCALLCTHQKRIPFIFNRFRTLYAKHPRRGAGGIHLVDYALAPLSRSGASVANPFSAKVPGTRYAVVFF